jgi:hypothetical protein
MKRIQHIFSVVAALMFTLQMTAVVYAGMPSSLRLSQYVTKYGTERMIGLSTGVFLGLIVSTLLIRICWGVLVQGTAWPKPTLTKSFAVTLLGGTLFFLVIVMIAGSRELFSPGAWEPDGVLYKLASSPPTHSDYTASQLVELKAARRAAIVALRDHLKVSGNMDSETLRKKHLTRELWTIPYAGGMQYDYHPEQDAGSWLAVEPAALEYHLPEAGRLGIDRKTWEIVEISSNPVSSANDAKTTEVQP